MEQKRLIFETVLERDVDFLLIEELNVNADFVKSIFRNSIDGINNFQNLTAFHSFFDKTGETDIYIEFLIDEIPFVILMENKVDAEFQYKQPERYALRKSKMIEQSNNIRVYTCLIAPEEYITGKDGTDKFDFYITYEVVKDYFSNMNDNRNEFKAKIMGLAIEKERRGYTAQKDPIVSKFWHKYWELLRDEYPEIIMKEPINIPVGSD